MKIDESNYRLFEVLPPPPPNLAVNAIPINWDPFVFARLMQVDTGYSLDYRPGMIGTVSTRMIRKDLAALLRLMPEKIFSMEGECDLREWYSALYQDELTAWYKSNKVKPARFAIDSRYINLWDYPSYASRLEAEEHFGIVFTVDQMEILKFIHKAFKIPTYTTISVETKLGKKGSLYRKDILHLVGSTGIPRDATHPLVESATYRRLWELVAKYKLHEVYPKITRYYPPEVIYAWKVKHGISPD